MKDGLIVAVILILLNVALHGQTINYSSFTIEYCDSLRIPLSVVWNLSGDHLGKVKRSSSMRFYEEKNVPAPRATSEDYTRSGYDRGHMCPAADRSKSVTSMRETFVMTNITPQVPALNRGPWKYLEDYERKLALRGRKLRIVAESVFWRAPKLFIGRDSVAVPHGFIKTIRDQETDTIIISKYFPNL